MSCQILPSLQPRQQSRLHIRTRRAETPPNPPDAVKTPPPSPSLAFHHCPTPIAPTLVTLIATTLPTLTPTLPTPTTLTLPNSTAQTATKTTATRGLSIRSTCQAACTQAPVVPACLAVYPQHQKRPSYRDVPPCSPQRAASSRPTIPRLASWNLRKKTCFHHLLRLRHPNWSRPRVTTHPTRRPPVANAAGACHHLRWHHQRALENASWPRTRHRPYRHRHRHRLRQPQSVHLSRLPRTWDIPRPRGRHYPWTHCWRAPLDWGMAKSLMTSASCASVVGSRLTAVLSLTA